MKNKENKFNQIEIDDNDLKQVTGGEQIHGTVSVGQCQKAPALRRFSRNACITEQVQFEQGDTLILDVNTESCH